MIFLSVQSEQTSLLKRVGIFFALQELEVLQCSHCFGTHSKRNEIERLTMSMLVVISRELILEIKL